MFMYTFQWYNRQFHVQHFPSLISTGTCCLRGMAHVQHAWKATQPTRAQVVGPGQGHGGAGLSHAIALQHGRAKAHTQEGHDLVADRGRACAWWVGGWEVAWVREGWGEKEGGRGGGLVGMQLGIQPDKNKAGMKARGTKSRVSLRTGPCITRHKTHAQALTPCHVLDLTAELGNYHTTNSALPATRMEPQQGAATATPTGRHVLDLAAQLGADFGEDEGVVEAAPAPAHRVARRQRRLLVLVRALKQRARHGPAGPHLRHHLRVCGCMRA